jgi:23S rRNA (uridine2552-2'-O)-methyltransferase
VSRELHDHYFKQAKREGYLSRAAYKLIEIDDRRKVLARGDRVLDCGAAPGSWLQVASKRVGPRGRVVGIDLTAIDVPGGLANVRVIRGDLRDVPAATLLAAAGLDEAGGRFDVLLSDMAPSTTGDRTTDHHQSARLVGLVLDLAPELLRKGGNLVAKVLEGETYPDLLARARTIFEAVKGFSPKASRAVSTEIFIVARGYRGPEASEDAHD